MLHKNITISKGEEQMVNLKVVLMKNVLQCKPTFAKKKLQKVERHCMNAAV